MTTDFIGLEEAPEADASAYVVPAPCVYHPAVTVHVAPRFRRVARCEECLQAAAVVGEPEPDTRPAAVVREVVPPAAFLTAAHPDPAVKGRRWHPPLALPATVATLWTAAARAEWAVQVWHSRGQGVSGSRVLKERDYWSVRMRGPVGVRAAAVYDGSAWGSMWAVSHLCEFRTRAQLDEYLRVEDGDKRGALYCVIAASENRGLVALAAGRKKCDRRDVHGGHEWGDRPWECTGRDKPYVSRGGASSGRRKEAGG